MKSCPWEFPGRPVVKTPTFTEKYVCSIPIQETKNPQAQPQKKRVVVTPPYMFISLF